MRNSRSLQGRATLLALTLSFLAGGGLAAQNQPMTMRTGGNDIPIDTTVTLPLDPLQVEKADKTMTTVPGAYTLPRPVYDALPTARSNRDLKVKKLGGDNDGDIIVLFTLRPGEDPLATFEPCDSFEVTNGEEEEVRPADVFCNQKGYLVDGGLVAVQTGNGQYDAIARIPPRKGPIPGTDVGVALTIMKTNDSHKGYEFFEGATAYYSLTRLRTSSVRLVANLSALDMDPKKDFETGLGFGVLLRTPFNADSEDRMGFGVLLGGGYNFMLDARRDEDGKEAEPWYWFVGFSWNFNRGNSNS